MQFTRRELLRHLPALTAAVAGLPALAQEFPAKQMKFVVPYGAGTTTDGIARFFADHVRTLTGQTVIVENRPGALGNIGAEYVAKEKPDGYTVLFSGNNTHAANVHLFTKLPFDPQKDFVPITTFARVPYILVVNPRKVPVKALKEFVAFAKANPGKMSYPSAAVGSRVAVELLKPAAGFEAVNVDYKASTQALTDLLSGELDFYFSDPSLVMPHIRAGKLTALAVSMNQRVSTAPEVPTVAEQGYPNFNLFSWLGIWTTAGAPPEAVNATSRLINRILATPEGLDMIEKRGLIAFPGTPESLRQLQTVDTETWGRVIRAAGIKPE